MALQYADNLEIRMRAPNVQRDLFHSIAEMAAYNENYLPDMFICVNTETGKLYIYNRDNTVDPVLGKWRTFTGADVDVDLAESEDVSYTEPIEITTGVAEDIECTKTVTTVGNEITTIIVANADSSDPDKLAAGEVVSIVKEINGVVVYEYSFEDSVIVSPFD